MSNDTFELDGRTYASLTPCCKAPMFAEACCVTHSTGWCSRCGAHLDSRAVWTVVVEVDPKTGEPEPTPMTTSSPRDTPESLREVASEIIRLYHSPAPQREHLDLVQRHGLAMARVLVEIDPAVTDSLSRLHEAGCGHDGKPLPARSVTTRVAGILDGSVAAEETTT